MTDLRWDESLARTDPNRARAIGAAQTTTGASDNRTQGKARAHERALQRAADLLDACERHAATAKRARGEYTGGSAPYGYTFAADGALLDVPAEREAIESAWTLARHGRPLRAIARQLQAQGFLPRSGKAWHPQTIARLIDAEETRREYARAVAMIGVTTGVTDAPF